MSSSLVRKSLAFVDEQNKVGSRNQKKTTSLKIPHKHKVHNLQGKSKLSIGEVQKQLLRSKNEVLKDNLKKLKKIRKIGKIQLDESLKEQIIERAVNRRPVQPKKKVKIEQKSAFTEEDFKKFEAEYLE